MYPTETEKALLSLCEAGVDTFEVFLTPTVKLKAGFIMKSGQLRQNTVRIYFPYIRIQALLKQCRFSAIIKDG